ncbi:hypothetical protein ACFPM3_12435 [Streptomyces coeruleoprunus]|uniref:Uncharacterized protein n=1 Tax=Streptomyces coeruleoprunus TaxID=285563 RepID=A0ABV9XE59_9ACTN
MGDTDELQDRDAARRRRKWWWIGGATAVLFCGLPGVAVAWGAWAFSRAVEPQQVSCAEAADFARATLPAGARDERCTAASWQDTQVTIEFRMPRDELAGWLDATYPGHEPRPSCEQDLCAGIEIGDADLSSVSVRATYEDGDTALVRLLAFDM